MSSGEGSCDCVERDRHIQSPYSEEPSLHSEGLHLIQKAKPIDLLLLILPHFGNVLFRGIVISVNWSLRIQLYHYSNTVYSLCLLVKLQKCIYTALVSCPLASSSNSTTVLPQLYVLIISFGVDPYISDSISTSRQAPYSS